MTAVTMSLTQLKVYMVDVHGMGKKHNLPFGSSDTDCSHNNMEWWHKIQ